MSRALFNFQSIIASIGEIDHVEVPWKTAFCEIRILSKPIACLLHLGPEISQQRRPQRRGPWPFASQMGGSPLHALPGSLRNAPRMGPRRPKDAIRCPQAAPKTRQVAAKTPRRASKTPQDVPKRALGSSKKMRFSFAKSTFPKQLGCKGSIKVSKGE